MSIQLIHSKNRLLAIVIRKSYRVPGIKFLSKEEWPLQIACIRQNAGSITERHFHPKYRRVIYDTMEVILVIEGKIKVDLYSLNTSLVIKKILNAGDLIIFISGGHAVKYLMDTNLIEVRQGPYSKRKDKLKF